MKLLSIPQSSPIIKRSMKKRSAFTLFELLLVVTLVMMTLGAVTISIPRALSKERFEKEAEHVWQQIVLAQELMLDTQHDVILRLDKKGCEMHPFLEKNLKIKEIDSFSFQEQQGSVTLYFDSTLGTTPKGALHIKGRRGESHTYLLPGFPGKYRLKEIQAHEAPYPQEILFSA